MRNTANPERTTLAHLADADQLAARIEEHGTELPASTANPRRTVLMHVPGSD